MTAERCDTCRCFLPPPAGSNSAFMPGFAMQRGTCRRYPTPVPRQPEDWCGEWSAPR